MKRFIAACFVFFLLFVSAAQAQTGIDDNNTTSTSANVNPLDRLHTIGSSAGYGSADETTVMTIIGTGINIILSLLGVIFIILILLAGFNWMTAAGEEEKIKKAGHTIRSAVIGLLIVVAAFAIWMFISQVLIGGTSTSSLTQPG